MATGDPSDNITLRSIAPDSSRRVIDMIVCPAPHTQ